MSSAPAGKLNVWHHDGGVRLAVRVQPRASRTEIAGVHGTALKVRLTAAPVDGAANEALVRALARWLDVPARAVRIVSGETSRSKIVELDGVEPERLHALLAAH